MLENEFKHQLLEKYEHQIKLIKAKIAEDDFSNCVVGERYFINEDLFFFRASVTAKDHPEYRLEAHEQWIDIQYTLTGTEKFIVGLRSELQLVIPYNSDKDIMWFEPKVDSNIYEHINHQGEYVIFFPEECHEPENLAFDDTIEKIVFKVRV